MSSPDATAQRWSLAVAQIERHAHVGEVDLVHRHFVRVHQCQVDLAFIDHAQQIDDFDLIGFFVVDAGILDLQCRQLLGVAAAFEHQDAFADQVARVGRARLTVAVDDLRRDLQIRVRETHLFRAVFGADQTGGCKHGAAGLVHLVEQVVKVVSGFDLQFHAQIVGETLDQFILETGFTVAILEVGRRAVAGDDAQNAILLDSFQRVGFLNTGTEHQEDSGCDEPLGTAWAEISWGEHLCSIRKAH